jgi:hypothetical protein
VERKTETTGAYAWIAATGTGITTYTDSTVVVGTTYCYRVQASNASGNSDYSNEACGSLATGGMTASGSPTALTVALTGATGRKHRQSVGDGIQEPASSTAARLSLMLVRLESWAKVGGTTATYKRGIPPPRPNGSHTWDSQGYAASGNSDKFQARQRGGGELRRTGRHLPVPAEN